MSELIDNHTRRLQALKEALGGLQPGQSPEDARRRLRVLVQQCDASEVAQAEQQLLAEGVPLARIQSMCDLHSQAVRDALPQSCPAAVPPGHPADVFRRENVALQEQAARLRAALEALGAREGEAAPEEAALAEARAQWALLMDVDKHYQRKEVLLFPFLEKRGITGPSQVMWAKDDEVRSYLKELGGLLSGLPLTSAGWRRATSSLGARALSAVEEMVFKEDHILLPLCLSRLEEAEWDQIAAQTPQLGYCLVDPVAGWRGAGHEAPAARADAPGALVFPTGALTLPQLQALFSALPVDVTFVDADDRVRFFSEGRSRVFHRAKAVIGRKVQNCHPPSSVGKVDRILGDFRAGRQEVAEFWLQMHGRFVHVRYFALRDESGAYLGTLEVTQDLTRERALTGEQRLLPIES